MEDMQTAFDALKEERDYQDALWGPTETRGDHNNLEMLTYIRSYAEQGLEALSRKADVVAQPESQHIMRKIGALAVAAMQQNGVVRRDSTDIDRAEERRAQGK
jgi:hypothetical protein